MYKVRYISPWGRVWDLSENNLEGFSLKANGVEGLVGSAEPEVATSRGAPGQVPTDWTIPPMAGALTGLLFPREGMSLEGTWNAWRSDWDHELYGTLQVEPPVGMWEARVRLPGEGMSAPETDLSDAAYIPSVRVPAISDQGVWLGEVQYGSGSVTVTNTGVYMVWPRVRWIGAFQSVTLPSGHKISLPNFVSSSGGRMLYLDPGESHAVVDPTSGGMDYYRWREVRKHVLPEGVPRGQTRTYATSASASLEWEISTLDPWRW